MTDATRAKRILVTGSRNWTDKHAIGRALFDQFLESPVGASFVVVHGDCPTGADAQAKAIIEAWGRNNSHIHQESHPADWDTHGKAAGPLRNQEMVDLGADVCLAFPLGDSRGTRDCMRRADAAGIRVIDLGGAPSDA